MNKVIIIGGDHHNSLGLARVFGLNGIKPYGIIMSPDGIKSHAYVCLSKYWEKTWVVKSEEEIMPILQREFSCEIQKPVLMPGSDRVGFWVDNNFELLSDKFLLPGVKNKPGAVAFLMNKMNQDEWAKQVGIPTAKSCIYYFTESLDSIKSDVVYPCIVKPLISAEGDKLDIKRCDDQETLNAHIEKLRAKGYKRVMIQEFLFKDYEAELIGCIPQNNKDVIPYIFTKNVREWPPVGGTGSYHEFIYDEELNKEALSILRKVQEYGYYGNIDIELFIVKGKLILNEVNLRNSGDVYYCFSNHLYYPYYLYLDMIGEDISNVKITFDNHTTPMNETTDLRHVVYGKLSLIDWIKCVRKCKDFAVYQKNDLKPVFRFYRNLLFKIFINNKVQKEHYEEANK